MLRHVKSPHMSCTLAVTCVHRHGPPSHTCHLHTPGQPHMPTAHGIRTCHPHMLSTCHRHMPSTHAIRTCHLHMLSARAICTYYLHMLSAHTICTCHGRCRRHYQHTTVSPTNTANTAATAAAAATAATATAATTAAAATAAAAGRRLLLPSALLCIHSRLQLRMPSRGAHLRIFCSAPTM